MVSSSPVARKAGGESAVTKLIGWVADLYESELECALDTFVSLIEPSLMMVMGILVGILLLATLLPMVNLLQTL